MGTDIHGIFQAKKNGVWVDIPHRWEQNRHYFLFAWLGNVRNGFGFAGVPTHEPITPLSDERGYPKDFDVVDNCHPTAKENMGHRAKYYDDGDINYSMGGHSHSWLLADEILSAKLPTTTDYGVITREKYEAWDKKSHPGTHSGGVWGKGVVVSEPNDITPETTHVQVSWANNGTAKLKYFIDEVRRLRDEHGDVRLVFGFDS